MSTLFPTLYADRVHRGERAVVDEAATPLLSNAPPLSSYSSSSSIPIRPSNPADWRRPRPPTLPVLPFLSPSHPSHPSYASAESSHPPQSDDSKADSAVYESPFSAFSSYQSDHSSPPDSLHSFSSPPYSPPTLLSSVLSSARRSVRAVVRWPVEHRRPLCAALLCAVVVATSGGEQVLRKALASCMYNYRYFLYLASSLASLLLASSLCVFHSHAVKAHWREHGFPWLYVAVIVVLDCAHCLCLILAVGVLPGPLALMLPQLLLPATLLSGSALGQGMRREVMWGCGLMLFALMLITLVSIDASASPSSDALTPTPAELDLNVLLMLIAVAGGAASYHVKRAMLTTHRVDVNVMNAAVGLGQVVLGLIIAPAAMRMQYVGTSRYEGIDGRPRGEEEGRGGGGGGGQGASRGAAPPVAGEVGTGSSASSGGKALSSSSSHAVSSSLSSAAAASSSLPSSSSTSAPSSSSSSSSFATSFPSPSSSAPSSSSLFPPSWTSSVLSAGLALSSSYLSPPTSGSPLSPLDLPVIPSTDYLPSPSHGRVHHSSSHWSAILNLHHATLCLLGINSEYGDDCSPSFGASAQLVLPFLLLQFLLFVALCIASQCAVHALQRMQAEVEKDEQGPISSPLVLPGALLGALFVALVALSPSSPMAGRLPWHQQRLLQWPWLLFPSAALLCAGAVLCSLAHERRTREVNAWEHVEALMKDTAGRSRSLDARDARDRRPPRRIDGDDRNRGRR